MSTKSFNVSFHTATHAVDLTPAISADLLGSFVTPNPEPIEVGAYTYKIVLHRMRQGVYRGELKRYGNDDLPHAGRITGPERELELHNDERTIERNYFLFFQQRRLLVWQENRRVSSVAALSQIISIALGQTISFAPVMTPEATRTLMLQEHRPKTLEFSVTTPRNPAMYAGTDDNSRILSMLAGLGGLSGSFRISANATGIKGRTLDAARALGLGQTLVESGNATRVKLELEGIDHPIDLFADRLKTRVSVEMNGRYPHAYSMFAQLETGVNQLEPQLRAIFGN